MIASTHRPAESRLIGRLFGAERGGLFWFESPKKRQNPILRAACNLTRSDIEDGVFQTNLRWILKSARENRSLVIRSPSDFETAGAGKVKAVLCIPIEMDNSVVGVLYHDNSYLDDCFDFLDEPVMRQLARHASGDIARILDYGRVKEKEDILSLEQSLHMETMGHKGILFQSQVMARLMKQADKVAASEATVLMMFGIHEFSSCSLMIKIVCNAVKACSAPGLSLLFSIKKSAISINPAFIA